MDFAIFRLRHVSNSDSKIFTHAAGAFARKLHHYFLLLQDLKFLGN